MINWKLKTCSISPIGLDIGHSSIKMIQLRIENGRIAVLARHKINIASDVSEEEKGNFVISAIRDALAKGYFRGRDVVSCLPNEKVKITSVRLAETEDEEIRQNLRKEVAQRFGLDADSGMINYLTAGKVQHGDEIKHELILFVADNEAIKSHIKMLEEAQLRPVAIDTVPCALLRGFERTLRRQEDKEQTVVFVDVGSCFTTVVFSRGGAISFVKQIQIGIERLDKEIAAKLGVSVNEADMLRELLRTENVTGTDAEQEQGLLDCGQNLMVQTSIDASTRRLIVDAASSVAEELAKEVSLCFRYYTVTFRGRRIEQAVFTGGGAYEKILLNILKKQLAVEIDIARPLTGFDMTNASFDSEKRGYHCEWAVAVGLSLKSWRGALNESDTYERN